MILYDCHMHTDYSDDSEEKMEEQVKGSIEKGLKGICITDHMDYEFPDSEKYNLVFEYDVDSNYKEIDELRIRYPHIEIMKGIEIGLRNEPGVAERTTARYKELLKRPDIDFVIGSTHCLELCDPWRPEYWQGRTVKERLRTFFVATLENIRANAYVDTLGHLDYAARYARRSSMEEGIYDGREDYIEGDNADVIDEILKFIVEQGIALEINSAGLKYGLGYAHPRGWILKRYKELGGEMITVGADAHKRAHIAYAFDEVAEILKDAGFEYYTVFRSRKPYMYHID
ncbi:MAG: histidinol-phosphatase HisJ family protein [Lachnospiraceae bacterium]|nr:histidinol-phosphatase HisJ family protein [Lachnospiraceae bacterium]